MDTKEKQTGVSRRAFFRTAAIGSAAAAGAAVVGGTDEAEAAEAPTSPSAAGYRETAHVKTYYELAKF